MTATPALRLPHSRSRRTASPFGDLDMRSGEGRRVPTAILLRADEVIE
jgi:hypothetical protein